MGKDVKTNGNFVTVRTVLTVVGGLLITLILGSGGWWLDRVDNQATAQGATIGEHAVKIARTEEQVKGVRDDVAEVKAALVAQDIKLDSQAGTLKDILTEVRK